jgi:putative restriction endonuclease
MCLNALHDRAFDRGLITFDNDLRVVVSPEIVNSEDNPLQRKQLIGIAVHLLRLPACFQPDASTFE